ncbi:hypothetical protein MVEN_01983700 [Mycena venus]|uniref:Uncharacterized protein n=1 Tax=Mycena venus TaxID=2733690 RepID=A0A8H7CKV9_9AGAR|nr:hypothetical protein MVEN_01983700 [Mycena venus]
MDNEAESETTFESTSKIIGSTSLETSGAIQLAGHFTAAMPRAGTAGNSKALSPAGNTSEFDSYTDFLQLMPYTETRSQQSPIKSHDASKEPLREDEADSATVYLASSSPPLMTSLISAGTASALLGWLISRRVKSADSNAFHYALVAIESPPTIFDQIFGPVQSGNDGVATTMYGLALSSLVVYVVPFTIPFVLGVFAYLLANMWLKGQKCGHVGSLPTPTQYGHLIGLCGSSGIRSVYDAAKYLLFRRRRPAVSTTLVGAFFATSFALLVNYSLSIADLWLHTTATTFSYGFRTPIPFDLLPAMGSRINTTLCPGPAPYIVNDTWTGNSNCQHSQPNNHDWNVSWGNAALINEGAAVLGNSSFSSQIQIIDNLATLLPKDLPSGVQNLVFSTFAMEATCKPVSDCKKSAYLSGTDENYLILCDGFTPPFAVSGETPFEPMLNQFNSTNNALIFQSGTPGQPASGVGPIGHTSGAGYALGSALNPAGVLVVLYWAGVEGRIDPLVDFLFFPVSSLSVRYIGHRTVYLSRTYRCHNITLLSTNHHNPRGHPHFSLHRVIPSPSRTPRLHGTLPCFSLISTLRLHDISGTIHLFSAAPFGTISGRPTHYSVYEPTSLFFHTGGELLLPDDFAGWYNHTNTDTSVTYSFYLHSCVLDVWDITFSYSAPSNGSAPSFTLVSSKTHSGFNTTSALLAALDAAYSATLASHLTTTLQGSLSVTSEEFRNFLARNLSQGILAYAAPLTERLNSTSGEALNSVTASRYPLALLCLVLALTYGYSILALGVGITAFTLSSREIICDNAQGQSTPQRISELDLLHLRLTSPRTCIADRFHASESKLPILKGDIFREAQSARRLGVGFLLSDGTVHCSDGGSGITLRNVRRFTVDIVEESKEEMNPSVDILTK